MPEVRCPTDNKMVGRTSDDFVGRVQLFCRKCHGYTDVGTETPDDARLRCECGKWLAMGVVRVGYVCVGCPRCKFLSEIRSDGKGHATEPVPRMTLPKMPPWQKPDVVSLIEERWELLRLERVHRSAEVAIGLRFDVFSRDGFRCRYCGRGPAQGVYLEADHVIPRSAGGPDTMANLVTACWDCNRGKSAKPLPA